MRAEEFTASPVSLDWTTPQAGLDWTAAGVEGEVNSQELQQSDIIYGFSVVSLKIQRGQRQLFILAFIKHHLLRCYTQTDSKILIKYLL